MGASYLRNTVLLLLGAFLLTGLALTLLFLPLINVIQYLSSETTSNACITSGYGPTLAISIAAVVASIASVSLIIRGLARDRSRRWTWVILLAVGLIILLQAIGVTVVAPCFSELYKDLHVGT